MLKRGRISVREVLVIALLFVVSGVVFSNLVGQMVYHLPSSDYSAHIQFARVLLDGHGISASHILYEILVIALLKFLPINIDSAGYLAATGLYVLTTLILYGIVRTVIKSRSWGAMLLAAGLALASLLVAPIIFLTLPEKHLYFGYIALNAPHTPTMVALKPFSLLLFVFSVGIAVNRTIQFSLRTLFVGIVLVFLCLLAKPNFVLILLPALLVLIAYRLVRRDTNNLKTILATLILPMVVFLAVAYWIQYALVSDQNGIMFAPLVAVGHFDPSLISIAVKFLLSIFFPALVYLSYWRQAVRDMRLNFAWLVFWLGAAQMYLFAESGTRVTSGNFWWSGQIGLFILFVVSLLFWVRHFKDQPRWRGWLCAAIFALHLISGLIIYAVQFQSVLAWDWW